MRVLPGILQKHVNIFNFRSWYLFLSQPTRLASGSVPKVALLYLLKLDSRCRYVYFYKIAIPLKFLSFYGKVSNNLYNDRLCKDFTSARNVC